MPRRTGKINSPDIEKIEAVEPEVEHTNQEEDQEEGQSMLNLKNMKELVFLGKLRETLDIGGFKFVVSTLTASQQRDIMRSIMRIDDADRILDLKLVTVSYAVETINGLPVEEFCEDESITSVEDKRVNVVGSFQAALLEKLYQTYERLTLSSNEELGLGDLKK